MAKDHLRCVATVGNYSKRKFHKLSRVFHRHDENLRTYRKQSVDGMVTKLILSYVWFQWSDIYACLWLANFKFCCW